MKVKLTKRKVDEATYTGDGRSAQYLWDTTIPGFGLRVYPAAKVFVLRYRTAKGKQHIVKIARYGELTVELAGDKAKDILAGLRMTGEHPAQAKATRSASPTVSDLIDEYVEQWAKPRKRTWKEDERQLEKDLEPSLGSWKAVDVTRADVRVLVEGIAERGSPIAANRFLAVVRRLFRWAVEQERLEASPADYIKPPSREERRHRVLTPDEIKTVWKGLDAVNPSVALALRLILATGQRPGEVCGMTSAEIEGKWWTIPAERSKNRQPHRVPLSNLVESLLKSGPPKLTIWGLDRATRKALPALGVSFRPHDLRRTCASHLTALGTPRLVVAKILNHTEQGVTGRVYDLYGYASEKRKALDAWARELTRITSSSGGRRR